MTIEELFFGIEKNIGSFSPANTRTYELESISERMESKVNMSADVMIGILERFNNTYGHLLVDDMSVHYRVFHIPKKTHGYRKICAPDSELETALRALKAIFENDFGCLYHSSAFAYVEKRSPLDSVKRHQANESKWFGKFDLSDFFGSTTLPFIMETLSKIVPFNFIIENEHGREELEKALSLGILNGGLPQGTPLSPMLTNLIMIPIDFQLSRALRQHNKQRFIYTRYADDFLISSKYDFDIGDIEHLIRKILKDNNAPYVLKSEKTRYGSSAGQNWNLGLMLNKDNEITVGHKRKRQLNAAINNYLLDRKNGNTWELGDLQVLQGNIAYVASVEKESVIKIVEKYKTKYSMDVMACLKADIKALSNIM